MKNMITVLIPTYNRREQLKNVLERLERQTNKQFEVVISNNASNYQIESILPYFDEEFVSRIRIINRRYNVGADINILELFTFCDTEWAWTLSDDELVKENAIEIIYNWIDMMPTAGCFNFTLIDDFDFEHECVSMTSIEEFIDVYKQREYAHGDLIFLSNKVYSMNKMRDFISDALKYIYTRVSTVILYERMLEKSIPLVCVNERIVEYNSDSARSWRIYEVILASRTLADVQYNVSKKQREQLLYIFSFPIRYVYYLYFVEGTVLKNEKYFFDQIYHGIYKYIISGWERIVLKVVSILTKYNWGYSLCRRYFLIRCADSEIKRFAKKILGKKS